MRGRSFPGDFPREQAGDVRLTGRSFPADRGFRRLTGRSFPGDFPREQAGDVRVGDAVVYVSQSRQRNLRAICVGHVREVDVKLQFTPDWPVRCVFNLTTQRPTSLSEFALCKILEGGRVWGPAQLLFYS